LLRTLTTGAHTESGPIREAFRTAGGRRRWGFPAEEPVTSRGVVQQRFERGTATLTVATAEVLFG